MIVRFGYVAMSTVVKNASPSKTMTATQFMKLVDQKAAIRKLELLAKENLQNTLRLLYHNKAHDIKIYRFSSKLIPLWGHEMLQDWNPIPVLQESFEIIGNFVKSEGMRVSFHPDHFTVISTPRADVLKKSMEDLNRHVQMFEAMKIDENAKCNIHLGGIYGDREDALERFLKQFKLLEQRIQKRITLENDDKTFNTNETLFACEQLGVPMVLDLHHHWVNHSGEEAAMLWPRIQKTWEHVHAHNLPPKIHISSPRDEKNPRAHADYVDHKELHKFLYDIAPITKTLDVMIEAKQKDGALFKLMEDLTGQEGVNIVDQATIEVE